MPKLKVLSGDDLRKIFGSWGFVVAAQRGSHMKLTKMLPNGLKQSITVPLHSEIDRGTLKAIYRQALRYVPEVELRSAFYSSPSGKT